MSYKRYCTTCGCHFQSSKDTTECPQCREVQKGITDGQGPEQIRICLMHGGKFRSKHKGNRICGRCRNTVDYENRMEYYNVSAISKVPKG